MQKKREIRQKKYSVPARAVHFSAGRTSRIPCPLQKKTHSFCNTVHSLNIQSHVFPFFFQKNGVALHSGRVDSPVICSDIFHCASTYHAKKNSKQKSGTCNSGCLGVAKGSFASCTLKRRRIGAKYTIKKINSKELKKRVQAFK